MPLTHSMTHLASFPIFISLWSASAHMLSVMTPVKVWGPAAKAMAAAAKTTAIGFFIEFSYRTVYEYFHPTMVNLRALPTEARAAPAGRSEERRVGQE